MKAGLIIPRFSCPVPFNFCRSPNTVSLRFTVPAIESTRRTVLPSTRAVRLNRVDVLSELLPCIQRFRDKTIVVKYGGTALESLQLSESVVRDLVLLSHVGLKIVLVLCKGPEIESWVTTVGVDPKFGDALIMRAVQREFKYHVLTLESLIRYASAGSIAFCDKNGDVLKACAAPSAAALGFLGELSSVNPDILQQILSDTNLIPVIAPIATDHSGQTYYIKSDTAAAEIAAAIGAKKLILLTDVAGILEDKNDPNSLIKEIDIGGIKKMIEEGKLTRGMIHTVECCLKSLTQGVHSTSIIDGRIPHSLLLEMLTYEGVGTMIRN